MPRYTTDYSKTIIYKIVCNDLNITDTYVGHTTNFVRRKCQHKSSCTNEKSKCYNLKVYQTIRANGGWDNWTMIQICEYPCNSIHEAILEERRYYELLNSKMNTNYIGKARREWVEENKDEILERAKKYYDENKDVVLERAKKYYDENKDIISEYRKKRYQKNKNIISEKTKEYRKIYKIENKDIISEKAKEYRDKNKQILSEKRKQKYNCCCGSISICIGEKSKHEKTKKHIGYLNQL